MVFVPAVTTPPCVILDPILDRIDQVPPIVSTVIAAKSSPEHASVSGAVITKLQSSHISIVSTNAISI